MQSSLSLSSSPSSHSPYLASVLQLNSNFPLFSSFQSIRVVFPFLFWGVGGVGMAVTKKTKINQAFLFSLLNTDISRKRRI